MLVQMQIFLSLMIAIVVSWLILTVRRLQGTTQTHTGEEE